MAASDVVAVLVVDDAAAFRHATADVVDALGGFRVAGLADSGEQALELMRSTSVDLVLMDVVMPGIGGVGAARSIHAQRPDVRIVLLSAHARDELPDLTAECQWCVFCPKEDFGPDVLEALWRALDGA